MHMNGITQLSSGNINTLDVQNGVYNFTGTGASVGALTFEGGTIAATPGTSALLTVGTLTLTDPNPTQPRPKTFVSITITVQTLSLVCGPNQCQLFTQNANLTTKTQKGYLNVIRK